MNKDDISRIYTSKIAELLSAGYQINPWTMSGCQGEIAKVDLTNGSEIIRVLIEKSCEFSIGNIVTITIGRVVEQGGLTIWNDCLEVCSQIKFAQIVEDYYTTYDEGVKIEEKREQRFVRRENWPSSDLGDAYKRIALRWIQRKPCMKSYRLKDIEYMTRSMDCYGRNMYHIMAKGQNFIIRPSKP